MSSNKLPKFKTSVSATSGSDSLTDEIMNETNDSKEVDLRMLQKEGSRVATLSALYEKMDFFQPKRLSKEQREREDQNRKSMPVELNPSTFNPYRPSLSNITPIKPVELPSKKKELLCSEQEMDFNIKPRNPAVSNINRIQSLDKSFSLPGRNVAPPDKDPTYQEPNLPPGYYTVTRRDSKMVDNLDGRRLSTTSLLNISSTTALTPMSVPKIKKTEAEPDTTSEKSTGREGPNPNAAYLTEEELDRLQEGMLLGVNIDPQIGSAQLRPEDRIENEAEKMAFLRRRSSEMTEKSKLKKVIINVHIEDGGYRTLVVDECMLARDVVDILIEKIHLVYDLSWQLMEENIVDKIERFVEDHEKVLSIHENWPSDKNIRFIFRQNPRKVNCFQTNLIDPYRLAEMSGELWIKKPNAKWAQFYCFLNGCRLFYSSKKRPSDKKHPKLFLELNTVLMYQCPYLQTRKMVFDSPTDFLILLKKINGSETVKDIFCLCAVDGPTYESWYQAVRFATSSVTELRKSYQMALKKSLKSSKEETSKRLSIKAPSPSSPSSMRSEVTSLFSELWYQGEMDRQSAEQVLLTDKQDGCFLVRFEDEKFWLAIVAFHRVHHIPIKVVNVENTKQYEIPNSKKPFNSLPALIAYFSKETVPSTIIPCKLTKGFQRKVFQF